MTESPLRILNLQEAAAFLRVHKSTLQGQAKAGLVPAAKVGRAWTFIESDLVAYLRGQYTGDAECRRVRHLRGARAQGRHRISGAWQRGEESTDCVLSAAA